MGDVRMLAGREALDAALVVPWNALAASRGTEADLYDTATWLDAWAAAANAERVLSLAVAAEFENGQPVALIALERRSSRAATIAGEGQRPRWRPVLRGRTATSDAFVPLVEELARSGVRALDLPGLPQRDPATAALIAALDACGFRTAVREASSECLAHVENGWEGHRSRFKKFERTARNFANKAARLGPVALDAFGGAGEPPASAAFPVYTELHARGWKGPLGEGTRAHRAALLARADAAGFARAFVFRVAGVPAAAILWFRIGEVAIAYSTVYDATLSALSAGTVVMWQSLERIFAEEVPALVDLLPGHGSQKDQLGPDRAPLLTISAARGTVWGGLRSVESAARTLAGRARRAIGAPEPAAVTRSAPRDEPVREILAQPDGGGANVVALESDPRYELLIALAGGHASPAATSATWSDGDAWYRIEKIGGPLLVRVGTASPRPVREVIGEFELPGKADLVAVTVALARVFGEPVRVTVPDPAGAPGTATLVRTSRFAFEERGR